MAAIVPKSSSSPRLTEETSKELGIVEINGVRYKAILYVVNDAGTPINIAAKKTSERAARDLQLYVDDLKAKNELDLSKDLEAPLAPLASRTLEEITKRSLNDSTVQTVQHLWNRVTTLTENPSSDDSDSESTDSHHSSSSVPLTAPVSRRSADSNTRPRTDSTPRAPSPSRENNPTSAYGVHVDALLEALPHHRAVARSKGLTVDTNLANNSTPAPTTRTSSTSPTTTSTEDCADSDHTPSSHPNTPAAPSSHAPAMAPGAQPDVPDLPVTTPTPPTTSAQNTPVALSPHTPPHRDAAVGTHSRADSGSQTDPLPLQSPAVAPPPASEPRNRIEAALRMIGKEDAMPAIVSTYNAIIRGRILEVEDIDTKLNGGYGHKTDPEAKPNSNCLYEFMAAMRQSTIGHDLLRKLENGGELTRQEDKFLKYIYEKRSNFIGVCGNPTKEEFGWVALRFNKLEERINALKMHFKEKTQ